MRNLLVLSSVFHPEPLTSAMMNYDLARALSKTYNVTVLRPRPSRPIGKEYVTDEYTYEFKCITLNSYVYPQSKLLGRFRESISFGLACKRYIEAHKDEIEFVYNDGWQLFGLYIVARTCVRFDIPYIIPIQDVYPESLFTNRRLHIIIETIIKYILLPIDRYYQKHAYRIRTISWEMVNYLSRTRKVSPDKYLVVDNWQNDDDFIYSVPENKDGYIFSYVGSINAHSNTEMIIRAFAEASISNSVLKIYGGGSHKAACESLAETLGISSKVYFDVVDKKDVPKVQSEADVLLVSLPKGNGKLALPSKITSYMFSGRPILASVDLDCAASRYIREAGCGLCVEPDDFKAMSEGFIYFAKLSFGEMKEIGARGRKYAEENLTRKLNMGKVTHAISSIDVVNTSD